MTAATGRHWKSLVKERITVSSYLCLISPKNPYMAFIFLVQRKMRSVGAGRMAKEDITILVLIAFSKEYVQHH